MLKKVLIANRGEIALRVIRACRDLNVRTVAVFSEADRNMRYVSEANESVHIGPAPATESYLVIDRVLAAAERKWAPTPYTRATGFFPRTPTSPAASKRQA